MSLPVSTRTITTPAKVNLCLEVLGRRDDGYHELATVFHAVGIYDTLHLAPEDQLVLAVEGEMTASEDNLVLRAGRALQPLAPGKGARIALSKTIPVGAGLGGGSSDAGAALVALSEFWNLRVSEDELTTMAGALGADVPVFLLDATAAVGTARGDVLTPLHGTPSLTLVIAVPPFSLPAKTGRIFSALRPGEFSDGARTADIARVLRRGKTPQAHHLWNGLFPAAKRAFADLGSYHSALCRLSGRVWTLSGAGPALFHLAADEEEAALVARSVASLPGTCLVVPSAPRFRCQHLD